MRLTLFEPTPGPITITTAAASAAVISVGLVTEAAKSTDAARVLTSQIRTTLRDPRVPAWATPAKDENGRAVGYVEGAEDE